MKWLLQQVSPLLDPRQFGIEKGSSTVRTLVELLHLCYTETEASKNYAMIIMLDYTKAFDIIKHEILMNKTYDF